MKNFTLTVNYGPGSRRVTEFDKTEEAYAAFLRAYDQPDSRKGKLCSTHREMPLFTFVKHPENDLERQEAEDNMRDIIVVKSSGNVFLDLNLSNADELLENAKRLAIRSNGHDSISES